MSSALKWVRKPLPFRYFYATLGILAVNLLLFVIKETFPVAEVFFPALLGVSPSGLFLDGMWWQPFTYMYIHEGFLHFFLNMLILVFIGLSIEERVGSWEFLLFYHLTGILSGIFSAVLFYFLSWDIPVIGASGAIFGALLAFATFYPRRIIYVVVIPVRSVYLVIILASMELFSQILNPYSGIAHLTHLAGFAIAYLYMIIRFGLNPWKSFWASDGYS